MARRPRIRRKAKLGFSFRFAVAVLYPILRSCVRWDIKGDDILFDTEGGILVAANHLSWFDPMVVSYVMWEADRPPRFMAKEAIFRAKFIGRIVRGAGQIPVYRETSEAAASVRDAVAAVDAGEAVVIYPEGTMTRDPNLWPMTAKTGAARIALLTGKPVIPMAQWGAQQVMRPYTKEFHLLPPKTISVRVGQPVDLSDLMGKPMDRQTLSIAGDRIMDAITALLAEIRREPAPAERFVFRRSSTDEHGSGGSATQ